jgi:hypothetical protein
MSSTCPLTPSSIQQWYRLALTTITSFYNLTLRLGAISLSCVSCRLSAWQRPQSRRNQTLSPWLLNLNLNLQATLRASQMMIMISAGWKQLHPTSLSVSKPLALAPGQDVSERWTVCLDMFLDSDILTQFNIVYRDLQEILRRRGIGAWHNLRSGDPYLLTTLSLQDEWFDQWMLYHPYWQDRGTAERAYCTELRATTPLFSASRACAV